MAPFRFIHTSDIHLDTSFAGSGLPSRLGDRKREAIRGTLKRILEDARRETIDLVMIAGDLFEIDRVTPDTIEFLKQQFENAAPIPIFIAPGNHDPYLTQSPYALESWPANVHIFSEEEFRSVELPGKDVRVTGFAFTRTRVPEPVFKNLPVLPADCRNFVLVHGSDSSGVPPGKSAHGPFVVGDIAGKNISYCALGHYHQQRRLPNPIDGTQIWYSGIPEGRAWDEQGICGYLLGEIGEDNAIAVRSCPTSQYSFVSIALNCDGFASREQIVDGILKLRGSAFDEKSILRVRLEGSPDPKLDLSKSEIEERLADAAVFIAWDDRTLPALDFEEMARERTLCGSFVRAMNHRIGTARAEDRAMLERARLYGAQALLGREVRIL